MPNFNSMEVLNEPEAYVPYRKHSSGDLQSRLKTRKILGVGETDNGDVHRSKISQVLGHNEHLFVRFPRLYWAWHLGMAIIFTAAGFTNIFTSLAGTDRTSNNEVSQPLQMMTTFYGSALLGFAFLLWSFFGTTDKALARGLMSAIVITQVAQIIALLNFAFQNHVWDGKVRADIAVRIGLVLGSAYHFWAIGSSRAGLRRSLSNKDLWQHSPEESNPSSPDVLKKTE